MLLSCDINPLYAVISSKAHSELMASQHFFFDVIYSHDVPSGNNLCKVILIIFMVNLINYNFIPVRVYSIYSLRCIPNPKP